MLLSDARILITEINKLGYKYDTFESQFIESLSQRKTQLSPKQARWLQQIYAKAVGGGAFVKREYGYKKGWR